MGMAIGTIPLNRIRCMAPGVYAVRGLWAINGVPVARDDVDKERVMEVRVTDGVVDVVEFQISSEFFIKPLGPSRSRFWNARDVELKALSGGHGEECTPAPDEGRTEA